MLICLPQGHPICRWLCFLSRTQTKMFNLNRYMRSKDTKRSVFVRHWTLFISIFTAARSDCPERVHTTAGTWCVFFFFLLYSGSQTYKYITTTYLSTGPLILYLQSQLGVSMVHLRNRWQQCTYKLYGLIWLSMYVFFFSKPWVTLPAIIWLTDCNGLIKGVKWLFKK